MSGAGMEIMPAPLSSVADTPVALLSRRGRRGIARNPISNTTEISLCHPLLEGASP